MFVSFALLAVSTAAAQTADSSMEPSVVQRLDSLEAQVQMLEQVQPCDTSCSCERLPAVHGDCRRGEFSAGFDCVLAKPHFKEAFQATIVTGPGTMAMVPFSYDYDVAPRAWFGYTAANGLGLRTRYWEYNQSADPFQSPPGTVASAQVVAVIFPAVITAIPPAVLNATDKLEVHTVDIEGTQKLQIGKISMLAGGGLRYAMMQQKSAAAVTSSGVVTQSLSWQRRFEGVGPTIGVEVERPLGGFGLAFVGVFRGSLLFGNKDLDRTEYNGSGGGLPIITLDKASEVLGIGEVELGLQWTRQLAMGDFFVRGTYEGQLWSDSGSPTLGYLGFQGFGIGCGFSR